MTLPYQVKDYHKSEGIITDVDPATGTVKGYFAVFGNIDSDRDMLMPGAFTKTLSEQGSRVRHVWQHDITMPLARPILTQDSKGLAFESKITPTTYGKNAILLYEDEVIDEHSFGYNTVKQQKMNGYTELREVRLWEGSTVTLGANSLSIGGMKSMTREQVIDRMDRVYKALRNGKYEGDEIFHSLDVYHQQLKQLFYDLTNDTTAVDESTQEPEEKNEDSEYIAKKFDSLNSLFIK